MTMTMTMTKGAENQSIEIRGLTQEDAEYISENIRRQDAEELFLSHLSGPFEAIKEGLKHSYARVAVLNGRPVIAWGVSEAGLCVRVGIPWLVATPEFSRVAFRFALHCKEELAKMFVENDILANYVSARNVKVIRWLKWLGFEFEGPIKAGPLLSDFYYFRMEKTKCAIP